MGLAEVLPGPIPLPVPTPTPAPGAGTPSSGGEVIPFPGGRDRPTERPSRYPSQEETKFCPDPKNDCQQSYEELIREFNWILQAEGMNENPLDPVQALIIMNSKIDYNRHARNHNARCPNKVPLFLVNDLTR